MVGAYEDDRDRPDLRGTSRLSPHLHWGEITAAQVWRAVAGALAEAGLDLEAAVAPAGRDADEAPDLKRSAGAFLRQLGWREFGHHLLRHFPSTPEHPLRETYARFPWRDDPAALEAWRRGLTGYPFVDAGMRELWATGWMHNRARLVTASFLVKHLLLPWRLGEDWFWDTLVDADLANNALGWQWVAGSGADAAPYFRVFNPVTQGRRYDPDGAYVRRWVPEIWRARPGPPARPLDGAVTSARRRRHRARRDLPLPHRRSPRGPRPGARRVRRRQERRLLTRLERVREVSRSRGGVLAERARCAAPAAPRGAGPGHRCGVARTAPVPPSPD